MKKLIISKLFILLLCAPLYAADEDTTKNTANDQSNNESSDAKTTDDSTDQTETLERVMPDPHKQQQRDIANMLQGSLTEIIELKAQDESFNLYLLAADEKEPLGNILFFADPRTHSDWPISLSPLRVGLSHYKWQTAVMTLPAIQLPKIPDRSTPTDSSDAAATDTNTAESTQDDQQPTTDENTETVSNEDSSSDPQLDTESETTTVKPNLEVIMARAQSSIEKLKETSDVIILIGIGQGATWATAYAETLSEADKEKYRLVLINAQQSPDISAKELNQMISQLKIDTFDVYSVQNKNSPDVNQALARKRAANQSEIENYMQIQAPSSAWSKRGNEWLYRKVLGLIKTNIATALEAEALENMKPKPEEKTNQKPGA